MSVQPCPFCGIGQIRLCRVFTPAGEQGEMQCLECGAIGPRAPYDEAVSRWNSRYRQPEPPQVAAVFWSAST